MQRMVYNHSDKEYGNRSEIMELWKVKEMASGEWLNSLLELHRIWIIRQRGVCNGWHMTKSMEIALRKKKIKIAL